MVLSLVPEPCSFVLCAIEIEERNESSLFFFSLFLFICIYFLSSRRDFNLSFLAEMTTKFNQELYTKMQARKNEPLSSLGKKVVRVVEKRISINLITSILETMRVASKTSVDEITPHPKRQCVANKGKEMVGS